MASKARTSVSAEAFGRFNKKEAFKPRVIEKSQDIKEKIRARLGQAFMFSGLDESEMTVVIDAMDEVKHKAGATVIKEGDSGDELYVVESGHLDCYK